MNVYGLIIVGLGGCSATRWSSASRYLAPSSVWWATPPSRQPTGPTLWGCGARPQALDRRKARSLSFLILLSSQCLAGFLVPVTQSKTVSHHQDMREWESWCTLEPRKYGRHPQSSIVLFQRTDSAPAEQGVWQWKSRRYLFSLSAWVQEQRET